MKPTMRLLGPVLAVVLSSQLIAHGDDPSALKEKRDHDPATRYPRVYRQYEYQRARNPALPEADEQVLERFSRQALQAQAGFPAEVIPDTNVTAYAEELMDGDAKVRDKSVRLPAEDMFFMSPYEDNFAMLDSIDDLSRDGEYVGTRLALKFQISQKAPFPFVPFHAKGRAGAYCTMTYKALFDLFEGEESSPITKQTFMPGVFAFYDFSARPSDGWAASKHVVRAGLFHESNGGYSDRSYSVPAKVFVSWESGFGEDLIEAAREQILLEYRPRNPYAGMVGARVFYPVGDLEESNEDITDYEGYVDLYGSWEWKKIFGEPWACRVKGWINPGDFLGGTVRVSAGTDLELTRHYAWNKKNGKPKRGWFWPTLFARYWSGYNEYLETYNERTEVVALGVKFY